MTSDARLPLANGPERSEGSAAGKVNGAPDQLRKGSRPFAQSSDAAAIESRGCS